MLTSLCLAALVLAAPPTDTAAEEKSIREFLETRQDAFIREDAKWLVSHFTEDGEFVRSSGEIARGRAEIEKTYRAIFEAPHHREVKTVQKVDEIRCVADDVAIVHASWALSNLKDAAGKPLPDRSGKSILVVVKRDGEWRINLLRADLKVPEAPKPVAPK